LLPLSGWIWFWCSGKGYNPEKEGGNRKLNPFEFMDLFAEEQLVWAIIKLKGQATNQWLLL
jgi:hypothetical protein